MIRVPVDPSSIEHARVRVTGADARHLSKVLRVKKGDAVIAFAGDGRAWDAVVASVEPMAVSLTLGDARTTVTESPCAILLGQGVGKGDKVDLVVRAATE
ncbi:MAG TPA: RsmE family RNA methyltransferase, partial [bacterium]|nr:RsmE family RNA methyltransferase [bacterium]